MINNQIKKILEEVTGIKDLEVDFASNSDFGDYTSNAAMRMGIKTQSGDFLKNIEWIIKTIKKSNFSKYYDHELPIGRLRLGTITYLRGSTFAKIRGFRENFDGHPEITKEYFWALPYVLYAPEHFIKVKKYKNRYLLVGHLAKQFAVVIEVDVEKTKNYIVSAFMVKDRYLKSREKDCLEHKKIGKPARTAVSSILAPVRRGGGSRFSTLQDTQIFYSKLEKESQGVFSLDYEIKNNPREQAEEIVTKLSTDNSLQSVVEKIEVAGPGFINFWLKKDILIDNLIQISKQKDDFGKSKIGNGKTVVIDYSSPNIAKPFGIGHLRSTVIGQTIYNLYKYLGYSVIGDNHLGDWGTQFGKLLYMIDKTGTKDLSIENLEKMYVKFHALAKKDAELEIQARLWFKKLEDGDITARTLWKQCVNISLNEFQKIYNLLGVQIDNSYGESFYLEETNEMLKDPKIIKYLETGENNSKIINIPNIKTPLMFLKSDGATTYATRDMATLQFRQKKHKPDIIVYEVGAEQKLYFEQLFAVAKLLKIINKNVELVHTAHGLYLAPDGKKFSTRKGKTIKLEEVLEEAIERARKLGNSNQEIAKQVGIGAIKYFDLMHSVQSNVVFDWDKMLAMEGNSGPYIQYTFARTQSVLQKVSFKVRNLSRNLSELQVPNLQPEESEVLRKLSQFSEVITTAAKSYSPNILCNYLYDLASKFNTFYQKHKILPEDRKYTSEVYFRLLLTLATGQVLKNGLKLLGIEAPEKM